MKPWYCANCNSIMELDRTGRCSVCRSDAVDIAVRPAITPQGIIGNMSREELESLFHKGR